MSFQFQILSAPSGQAAANQWPFTTIWVADSSGKIILPVSGTSVFANGAFTVIPVYPNVILDGSGQMVTLSTTATLAAGSGVFPPGPNWQYQMNTPNFTYSQQLVAIYNSGSTAATIQSDQGTINSSATFPQSAGSVYVFQFNQSASTPNWTPNLATSGANFHYW
jgi:hypothetical protein